MQYPLRGRKVFQFSRHIGLIEKGNIDQLFVSARNVKELNQDKKLIETLWFSCIIFWVQRTASTTCPYLAENMKEEYILEEAKLCFRLLHNTKDTAQKQV